ncbi:MAG: hypothetical protein IPH37_16835 [Burkholderiales bacterium]|nr:hypothetical protein [Burkholderiales bacterium]
MKTVEVIPDYANPWCGNKNFEVLKNQYFIAQRQFEMLELLDGQIQFPLTECSLPQVLYSQRTLREDNICDIAKTRKQILGGTSIQQRERVCGARRLQHAQRRFSG